MSWSELFARRALGVRLGLDAVAGVFDALGRPCADVPTIHVVGTNGKGSVAAMADHALRRHGRRVGLYTSPHLVRVGERVRIDGAAMDDDALAAHVAAVLAHESIAPRPLTFFELLTLAALHACADAGVDALVAEAGLGGRLDATRVVSPTVTVVTSIGMDHAQWLGDTLAAIAAEKAAVFVRGVPVVAAKGPQPVHRVLVAQADRVGTTIAFPPPTARPPHGLPGAHQADNAGLALAAVQVLQPDVVATDLDGTRWPGRLQSIAVGEGTLWLDAAHNLPGIEALVAFFAAPGTPPPTRIVFGCMDDKPAAPMLATLRALGASLEWVDLGPGAAACPDPSLPQHADPEAAWVVVADALAAGETVVACGSLRWVGAAMALLQGERRPDAQDPVRPTERHA